MSVRPEPSALIVYILADPIFSNARCCESGDQLGRPTQPRLVSWVGVPPVNGIVHRSCSRVDPDMVPRMNATVLPSGDNAAKPSPNGAGPLLLVSWACTVPQLVRVYKLPLLEN